MPCNDDGPKRLEFGKYGENLECSQFERPEIGESAGVLHRQVQEAVRKEMAETLSGVLSSTKLLGGILRFGVG